MSFEQRLNQNAQEIEQKLESICREVGVHGVPKRLHDAMAHALLAGGKRFRPFLVLECANLFGVEKPSAIQAACAIECVHCYSLTHDDLPSMDNDDIRRGKPSVWAAYDEWTAILAGDALQSLAFQLLSDETTHDDATVRVRLVQGLASAAGCAGMVGGQTLDIAAEKLNEPSSPDTDHVKTIQAMKTGALIRFSCEAGAILASDVANPKDYVALSSFGEHLGYAFQIADDLLDAHGDARTVGKAVAKDTDAGKATLVSTLGIEATRECLSDVHAKAMSALDRFGEKAMTLRAATDFVCNRNR